jgi:hypothetical protein
MQPDRDPKDFRCVSIRLGNAEGRIEELASTKTGPAKMRISCWSESQPGLRPLEISEKDLLTLLQKAIREGIISPAFINDLRSEFII